MRALSTLLLLLLSLSGPAMAESDRDDPTPDRIYRQLREDPPIRTREEALEFLAELSPGTLWRSSKLSVDRSIQHLLSHAGFESLAEEVQSQLHANMLKVRSAFWAEDPERLSSAQRALRRVWESGSVISMAANPEDGEELQHRLLQLVEEVEVALTLQACARVQQDLGSAAYLDCLLRGGPGD
jgi:hypothetical protein